MTAKKFRNCNFVDVYCITREVRSSADYNAWKKNQVVTTPGVSRTGIMWNNYFYTGFSFARDTTYHYFNASLLLARKDVRMLGRRIEIVLIVLVVTE